MRSYRHGRRAVASHIAHVVQTAAETAVGGGCGTCRRSTFVERRTWHLILQWLVNVDLDPRLTRLVERSSQGSRGQLIGSRSCHLEVDAMRVVLCSIDRPSTVKGNDLMSQDVIPCCNG